MAAHQRKHAAVRARIILLRLRLEVRLQEPEILVEFARELSKEIDSDVISEIAGFLDSSAQGVGVVRDIMDEPL